MSECTVCRYPLCATVRPNQHLFFELFGAQPGRGFRQADVSARAVGESISLDGTAAFFLSLSFVHLLLVVVLGTSGRVGRWASGTPQCVAAGGGGLVLPTGLVGHGMLVWVLCMYVRIMYNKMGAEAESPACLGRCTYNTGKAAAEDVVTK